jgi:protein-S-isoprenylcysteine O-methyltransferase Ste14
MDTFRYILALLFVLFLPPMLLYWPIVHGFIGFWRRVGPVVTYAVVLWGGLGLAAFGLYQVRGLLLQGDLGTNWVLVALGAFCIGAGGWLRVLLHRTFSMAQLMGLPELSKARDTQGLVRAGLYARVRHPRYLQYLLALLGYALVANYPAVYLIWLLWLPGVYVTVLFEERELRQRFGPEYEEYCREVPRFLPRLGKG